MRRSPVSRSNEKRHGFRSPYAQISCSASVRPTKGFSGGIQGGRVVGSSDKIGAYPATDPVSPGDLAATIFSSFGVDPLHEIRDITGRPWRLAEGRRLSALF